MPLYEIQDEILTKTKFWGLILLTDIVYGAIVLQLISVIYERAVSFLKYPTIFILVPLAIFWVLPSIGNKGKKNYQRLWFILRKNRHTYQTLPFYEVEEAQETSFFGLTEEEEKEIIQEGGRFIGEEASRKVDG